MKKDTDLLKSMSEVYMDAIPIAMQKIRKGMRQHRGSDLTLPQFRVLANVRRHPKTNKDLADNIGLSVAAMSRLIQGLIKEGYLTKTENPLDKRESKIRLSKKGEKLIANIRAMTRVLLIEKFETLNTVSYTHLRAHET